MGSIGGGNGVGTRLAGELRLPLAIYAPVVPALVGMALARRMSPLAVAGLGVAGVLLWTLMEYVIHRFVLHLALRGRLRRFLAGRHVLHHRDPDEHPGLIAPWVSLPVAAGFLVLAAAALGAPPALALTAGVVVGYLLYEYTHLAIHAGGPNLTPWSEALVRHHIAHHRGGAGANFAILLPVWDRVWRTRRAAGDYWISSRTMSSSLIPK